MEFSGNGAIVSDCQSYRYALWRMTKEVYNLKILGWMMYNPSTADAASDDPTVRRVIDFTRSAGYGIALVCNLYGLRSTDPKCIKDSRDPIGPENDAWIAKCDQSVDRWVAAWGALDTYGRFRRMKHLLKKPIYCYGMNKNKSPKHPLYLRSDALLDFWRP